MRTWPAALLLALLAAPLPAQDPQLSSTDQAGNFYSVLNLFTGTHEYVQIRKLDPGGGNLWTQVRDPGVDQRAAAMVTDPEGGVMVASVMKDKNRRVMVIFHYTANGQYDWQRVFSDNLDDAPNAAAADREGNYFVAGSARKGSRTVARLWKYDPNGGLAWMREYDNMSGNTYTRQLQVDLTGNASVGIESVQSQTATSGQYSLVTVTYDRNGNQVSVR
jgi:hypothetical protein